MTSPEAVPLDWLALAIEVVTERARAAQGREVAVPHSDHGDVVGYLVVASQRVRIEWRRVQFEVVEASTPGGWMEVATEAARRAYLLTHGRWPGEPAKEARWAIK